MAVWNEKVEKKYYKNGVLHRTNGPARIKYNIVGNIVKEEYWTNGLLHKLDGPAVIEYYNNGNIKEESYYIDGTYYDNIFLYSVMVGNLG